MNRLLLATSALLLSCSGPMDVRGGTLVIELRRYGSVVWPWGSGTRMTLSNELDDPRGFAGFELDIAGTTLTARHFAVEERPAFGLPDTGRTHFTMRLMQDGQVVAEGSGSWELKPGAEWRLEVNRAPYPPGEGFTGFGNPGKPHPDCTWFWCHAKWRFPIEEHAANYEHEGIWLTLYREDICADICP